MKPDHEAAKKWAEQCRDDGPWDEADENNAACYLDTMAQLDKATELLSLLDHVEIYTLGRVDVAALRASIRAFLDERE